MVEARDVLAYLTWWDTMFLWEEIRRDATQEWNMDMSYDEMAACAGTQAPMLAPGDVVMNTAVSIQLYWPATQPKVIYAPRDN